MLQGSVRQTPMYNYMIEQYRAHLVTGSKLCKHQDELRHVAQTYLCLLESTARQQVYIGSAWYSGRDRWFLTSELSLSCARPAADGDHLCR